jgi:hypothetical protein
MAISKINAILVKKGGCDQFLGQFKWVLPVFQKFEVLRRQFSGISLFKK